MSPSSPFDHLHLAQALRLAEHGLATTQPNPRVGCVIADGADVVGSAWHVRAGAPHAEVLALRDAGARARGATAYVTLEPCGLHGRTPPCADALIAAGIRVESGLMGDAARELNRGFFSRIERGRPWVRVKLATSLDGRSALANGASKWISGESARADVQHWRARSSALLTGIGTVLADDPRLTVRDPALVTADGGGCVPPVRVVLDRALRTPATAHVLDGSVPTLVVHAADARTADARFDRVERIAIETRERQLDLAALLRMLAARAMNEVQVEAGAVLAGSLVAAGLVDELLLYIAPILLGDSARPLLGLPALAGMHERLRLRVVDERKFGEDWRVLLRAAEAN